MEIFVHNNKKTSHLLYFLEKTVVIKKGNQVEYSFFPSFFFRSGRGNFLGRGDGAFEVNQVE